MEIIKKICIVLTLLTTIAVGSFYFFKETPQTEEIDTSNRYTLNILFIGNSYTFFNNMPSTLEQLAKNDPSSRFIVNTEMLVEGGATLGYFLLNTEKANKTISSRRWDYIVLQPQSEWANTVPRTRNTDRALSIWRQNISKNGTRLVFFMTWPRQPQTNWYKTASFSHFNSHLDMHNAIKKRSIYFTKKYNLILAPVGDYWTYANRNFPNLNLYDPDGSHPSPEGSFLTALIFYRMMVDSTVKDIINWPNYINTQEKENLIKLVSKKL